ncbi:ABC transporter ATP-binding protein [Aliidongia dinghuensis]|uniref:ABC transporter ATP-binding protein n=1 Tax=Aliidongia dinghuensis TaxID=1867774 RepID=A0A8J2YS13_9PROT|nr:ABC transporter ATP-binding protein [Aliidongia dinghuensis]GGF12430.1 ABC transporter ATP-binding protein [Aliidongia dinghuensis]
MSEPVISVENLSVALPRGADRRWAVEDMSLTVERGEILCVVGESGSGKSVLASALMGALASGLKAKGGRVLFEGEDLARAPARRLRSIRGNKIAMIFQEPMAALNPAVPAGKQVEEVFEIHAPAMGAEERRRRALKLLADTHLPEPERIAASYPHQLSGGQCQRVVIAMALAMEPLLLIADEPTTALDVTTQAQILKLVRELRDDHGHGILFVTHDFGVVADIADRVAVMQGGRLVEIGAAADVLTRPQHPYTKKLLAAVPSLAPAAARPMVVTPPAIRLEGVCKSYGRLQAVRQVTLEVPRGATLAVVGESGSGKSTLAKTVIRLIEPSDGRVLIEDVDFARLPKVELNRRRRLIQMIFQDPYGSLNPRRTVGDMLVRAGVLGGASTGEARRRAAELVELVGLRPEALGRKPHAFSGGQRQRIGIARALAMNPSIIIADESVSALDVSVQKQVLELLEDLQRRTGLTMLFITHDLRVAAQIADLIAVMQRGEVVEFGPAAEVLFAPRHTYTAELVDAAPGRHWQRPAELAV